MKTHHYYFCISPQLIFPLSLHQILFFPASEQPNFTYHLLLLHTQDLQLTTLAVHFSIYKSNGTNTIKLSHIIQFNHFITSYTICPPPLTISDISHVTPHLTHIDKCASEIMYICWIFVNFKKEPPFLTQSKASTILLEGGGGITCRGKYHQLPYQ